MTLQKQLEDIQKHLTQEDEMPEPMTVKIKLIRRIPSRTAYGYDQIELEAYVGIEEDGSQQPVTDQLLAWDKALVQMGAATKPHAQAMPVYYSVE
jgi:hypothetical protein